MKKETEQAKKEGNKEEQGESVKHIYGYAWGDK